MKKILICICTAFFACSICLYAQTPEEIVQKMDEQLARADAEGFTMDFSMKMPIVGTIKSHNMIRGHKMRMEILNAEVPTVTWTDETTKWDYDGKTGEITITNKEESSDSEKEGSNLNTFNNITDGYDVILQKETEDAWYFLCKKSKTNKVKDDPKKMDLVVSKGTYLPLLLSAKQSVFTIGFENITIGVPEESVTFNPAEFPDAKIIDKR